MEKPSLRCAMAQQEANQGSTQALQVAILGGGCFWCLEAVYQQVRGVVRVESG
jgi:peptide-methionine (S)-S-oxide reductase